MVSLLKTIKPKRLNEQAMKDALYNAIRRVRTKVLKDYEGTVETWHLEDIDGTTKNGKPVFVAETSLAVAGPRLEVYTMNAIYRYVDGGTKPHDIWAGWYTGKSEHKALAFASAWSPKTTPNSLKSGAGSKGEVDTYTPYAEHPGAKARNFSEMIAKKNEKVFRAEMEKGMKDAAKASGHGG
jgi:hypothetical protein